MTTTALTVQQLGRWNDINWADAVFGLVDLGGSNQVWIQFLVTFLSDQIPDTMAITITPGFAETGTLSMYAYNAPLTTNFTTGTAPTLPNATRPLMTSSTVTLVAPPTPISIPLYGSNGGATPFLHTLRANVRPDANGNRRAALGLTFSGTGGPISVTLSATHASDFTGLAGHIPSMGENAVKCPRCGFTVPSTKLRRDGYLKIDVCEQCYDLPPPPPQRIPRWS